MRITPDPSDVDTYSEQKKAPMNSARAPKVTSFDRLRASEPYEVARPLLASLAPIEKDIKKLKITDNSTIISLNYI